LQTKTARKSFCDPIDERNFHMPELHILLEGLAIGESPRWHEGRLWFSNWGMQEVISVDLEGKSEVMVRVPTTVPFSIDWLPDGRLLVVSGREGLLLRRESNGSLVTHTDLTSISNYPWNEIVVDGRSNAYINNINFDFPNSQQFAPGIIALITPNGSVRPVADGLAFPNGMAITPDNKTLIVAESYANQLTAFDIDPSGDLSNRRVWANLPGAAPDGICLDAEGAVWYGDVPNQRCVHVREGGEILQTINLDRGCFACMLGGVNTPILFMMVAAWHGTGNMSGMVSTGQVLTIKVSAPAAGWP
jgi:sugar lactone lactonase YvrE